MADVSIARRYAQALFAMSRKGGVLERVETDLDTVDALIRTQPNLLRIMRAPTIPRANKKDLVRRLFESQISPLTLRFLSLLIDKRREATLPDVSREFRALSDAARNVLPAVATVAARLTTEERARLTETLARRTGKTIELREEVDPELIGGVVIRLGDTIIDGSIAGQLRRLHQQLLADGAGAAGSRSS
jgi:F-type H+-transporting ATPase subunit delta